jgi:translocation and assembly module TamA
MSDWKRGAWVVLPAVGVLILQGCSFMPWSAEKQAAAAAAENAPQISAEISGIDGELAANVRAHLSVTNKPCTISQAYLAAFERRSEDEAKEALRALGYYEPDVEANIEPGDACPIARLTVNPGTPVLLGKVTVDIRGPAGDDADFQHRIANLGLAPGKPLNHETYTAAKRRIESVALELGYLEGIFVKNTMRVNPARRIADVTLAFNSGPRYRLGEISILQEPDFLDEALIRRFLENAAGEPYNAARVAGFHTALSKGSYFNRIEVRPKLSETVDNTVPIAITLTPQERHKVTTGIGASTDEGIRGRASYKNRRINRYGHQLDVGANASSVEQKLSVGYSLPRNHPVDEWLTLQTGVKRLDVDTFDSIEAQVVLSETKRRPRGWMETRFLEWSRTDFDVSSTNDATIFLTPGAKWRKAAANNDLFPTRGYSIEFEVKGAAESVFSSTSFARSRLRFSSILGITANSRLLLRGRFGALWVDDFDQLPPSERFFAGGDNSIRGYDIDSRGPVDANGKVIGGTQLGIISAEVDYYFTERWGFAAFVDSGNAFGGEGSSTGLQTGAGVGLRWRSPIGPIRVDIAHPLGDTSNDFRLHLRIGPDL